MNKSSQATHNSCSVTERYKSQKSEVHSHCQFTHQSFQDKQLSTSYQQKITKCTITLILNIKMYPHHSFQYILCELLLKILIPRSNKKKVSLTNRPNIRNCIFFRIVLLILPLVFAQAPPIGILCRFHITQVGTCNFTGTTSKMRCRHITTLLLNIKMIFNILASNINTKF